MEAILNQFSVIYKNREQSLEQLATKMMYFFPYTPSTRGAYEQAKTLNASIPVAANDTISLFSMAE